MDIKEIVSAYIKLREKKALLKKRMDNKIAPINEAMAKLEGRILESMQETGVDSFKTELGTAYKSVRTSATVADWDTFLSYVLGEEMFELLEHRASKKAVQEFKDEYEDLPPGLNWREEVTVNFRKS